MSHVYQLSTSCHNQAGNFAQNIWHYELSEAGSGTAWDYANALVSAWLLANMTDYCKLFGQDVVVDYMAAKRVSGLGGPSAVQQIGNGGGNTNSSISAGIAADLVWQSASPLNRAAHTFIPYLWKGAIEGDTFVSSFPTDAANFIQDMLAGVTLGGGLGNADFGLYSRSTLQFNKITNGQLSVKATMLNKRTLPQI